MKCINFKDHLSKIEKPIGGWISLDSSEIHEMIIEAFDWVAVDLEHSTLSLKDAQRIVEKSWSRKKPCLIRISSKTDDEIKSVLDAGASGIIAPNIKSAEEAENIIKKMFYPPHGERGVGLYRAQDYGQDFEGYSDFQENGLTFIPQIEHVDGVKNLDSILGMKKVDGFFIGPYDLSASIGDRGNFSNPQFLDCLKTIDDLKTDKFKGYHLVHYSMEKEASLIANGYNLIAYSSDMILLSSKIDEFIKQLQS